MNQTILIVDDIRINNVLLKQMFATKTYNVIAAESGATALEIIKDNKVDLVLLDLMMPVMNGYEVLSAIKNNPHTRNVKVIILTAFSDSVTEQRVINMGADGFLTKPLNRVELLNKVGELIG